MQTDIKQMEIPFDEPVAEASRGKAELFPERERAMAELKRRFGLPLNTQVRVTIKDIPGEFVGKLTLDSLLFPEKAKDAIPMRLGRVTFDLRDIESCSRIE